MSTTCPCIDDSSTYNRLVVPSLSPLCVDVEYVRKVIVQHMLFETPPYPEHVELMTPSQALPPKTADIGSLRRPFREPMPRDILTINCTP